MSAADPPVEVMEADGVDVFGVCPMKQLLLCNVLPGVLFHHVFLPAKQFRILFVIIAVVYSFTQSILSQISGLVYIPLKHFPEGFVLYPHNLLNAETSHGGVEKALDSRVLIRITLQLHFLREGCRHDR